MRVDRVVITKLGAGDYRVQTTNPIRFFRATTDPKNHRKHWEANAWELWLEADGQKTESIGRHGSLKNACVVARGLAEGGT